jgi:hypothetical protein
MNFHLRFMYNNLVVYIFHNLSVGYNFVQLRKIRPNAKSCAPPDDHRQPRSVALHSGRTEYVKRTFIS